MSSAILTDEEIDTILELARQQCNAPWAEGLKLLEGEIRRLLERGYGSLDACIMAFIFTFGGCQCYVPRVSTFLSKTLLINSRCSYPQQTRSPIAAYKQQIAELKKLKQRQKNELAALNSAIEAQRRQITERRKLLAKAEAKNKELSHAQ